MLKKFLIVLIVVLSGLLIYQIVSRAVNSPTTDTTNSSFEYEADDFHDEQFNKCILDSTIVVKTYKSNDVLLQSLNHKNTIFVRYSVHGCTNCINNLLSELTNLKDSNDSIDIIMLLKNIGSRDLYVNWVSHDKKFQMYQLDNISLDTIATPDSPYLFRIDNNGMILDHFICQYGDKENLNNYLKTL